MIGLSFEIHLAERDNNHAFNLLPLQLNFLLSISSIDDLVGSESRQVFIAVSCPVNRG